MNNVQVLVIRCQQILKNMMIIIIFKLTTKFISNCYKGQN